MFQLTSAEFEILKSQIVTSSWGGTRKLPFAFIELCKTFHNSVYVIKKIMYSYLHNLLIIIVKARLSFT